MDVFFIAYWIFALLTFAISITILLVRTRLKKHPSDPWFVFYMSALALLAISLLLSQNRNPQDAHILVPEFLSLSASSLVTIGFINYAAHNSGVPLRLKIARFFVFWGIGMVAVSITAVVIDTHGFLVFVVLFSLFVSVVLGLMWISPNKRGSWSKFLLFTLPFVFALDISREFINWWPEIQKHYIVLPAYYMALNIILTREQMHNLTPLFTPHPEIPKIQTLDSLSAREQEIAVLISRGLSYQEIADALFISLSTVKTHLIHIYSKTSSKNKIDLINKMRIEHQPKG